MSKVSVALAFVIWAMLISVVCAEETVERLNLARCIETALRDNPSIIIARSVGQGLKSRIGQAESVYYPQVNWTSSYKKTDSAFGSSSSTVTDQYASSINLTQSIYDFGRTRDKVALASINTEADGYQFADISSQVVFNVKSAYFGLLQTKRNLIIAREIVEQFSKHLDLAKELFAAGVKPKIDVTKAEVDLSSAKVNLIKADNSVKIAVARLNNVTGRTSATPYDIEDNLDLESFDIEMDTALASAYGSRADLLSLASKRASAEKALELSRKGYYPDLTGSASYGVSGQEFPLDQSWNIGVVLSVPVFSGRLTEYQVREADANLDIAKANEMSLRQSVYLEVSEAYLRLAEAGERIKAAEITIRQATDNLDLAKSRYAAGVGSPIEITDALLTYASARTEHIQALYDYKISQVSLEKAMGTIK